MAEGLGVLTWAGRFLQGPSPGLSDVPRRGLGDSATSHTHCCFPRSARIRRHKVLTCPIAWVTSLEVSEGVPVTRFGHRSCTHLPLGNHTSE